LMRYLNLTGSIAPSAAVIQSGTITESEERSSLFLCI
jgi:hypothetical protein